MSLAAAGAMLVRRISYCSSLITCETSFLLVYQATAPS